MSFKNATVQKKANVYHGGKVSSRSVVTEQGETKTLGFMLAGTYNFSASAAELMEILAGSCRVRLAGESDFCIYAAGESFAVPANSSFDIEVNEILDYICHYQ
ncbi:MAG: pyrimidine/purine nucleoside phosphorylase [Mariprofundaceae bacterium]